MESSRFDSTIKFEMPSEDSDKYKIEALQVELSMTKKLLRVAEEELEEKEREASKEKDRKDKTISRAQGIDNSSYTQNQLEIRLIETERQLSAVRHELATVLRDKADLGVQLSKISKASVNPEVTGDNRRLYDELTNTKAQLRYCEDAISELKRQLEDSKAAFASAQVRMSELSDTNRELTSSVAKLSRHLDVCEDELQTAKEKVLTLVPRDTYHQVEQRASLLEQRLREAGDLERELEQTKRILRQRETETFDLQSAAEEKQRQLDSLQGQFQQLNEVNKELSTSVGKLSRLLDVSEDELNCAKESLAQRVQCSVPRDHFQESETKRLTLESDCIQLRGDLEKVTGELQQRDLQLEESRRLLDEKIRMLQRADGTVVELQVLNGEQSRMLVEMTVRVSACERALSVARLEIDSRVPAQLLQEVTVRCEQLATELEALKAAKSDLDAARELLSVRDKELDVAHKRIAGLEAEAADGEGRQKELVQERDSLHSRLEALTASFTMVQEQFQWTSDTLSASVPREQLEAVEIKCHDLSTELQGAREESLATAARLQEREQEVIALQSKCADCEARLEDATRELGVCNAQISSLETQLGEKVLSVDALARELLDKSNAVTGLEGQLRERAEELDHCYATITGLRETVAGGAAEATKQLEELTSLQAVVREQERLLDEGAREEEQRCRKTRDLEEQSQVLRQALSDWKQQAGTKEHECGLLHAQLSTMTAQCNALTDQLMECTNKLDELVSSLRHRDEQLRETRRALGESQSMVEGKDALVLEYVRKLEAMKSYVAEKETQHAQHLESLSCERDDLAKQLLATKAVLVESELKMEELVRGNKELSTSVAKLYRKLIQAEEEAKALKDTTATMVPRAQLQVYENQCVELEDTIGEISRDRDVVAEELRLLRLAMKEKESQLLEHSQEGERLRVQLLSERGRMEGMSRLLEEAGEDKARLQEFSFKLQQCEQELAACKQQVETAVSREQLRATEQRCGELEGRVLEFKGMQQGLKMQLQLAEERLLEYQRQAEEGRASYQTAQNRVSELVEELNGCKSRLLDLQDDLNISQIELKRSKAKHADLINEGKHEADKRAQLEQALASKRERLEAQEKTIADFHGRVRAYEEAATESQRKEALMKAETEELQERVRAYEEAATESQRKEALIAELRTELVAAGQAAREVSTEPNLDEMMATLAEYQQRCEVAEEAEAELRRHLALSEQRCAVLEKRLRPNSGKPSPNGSSGGSTAGTPQSPPTYTISPSASPSRDHINGSPSPPLPLPPPPKASGDRLHEQTEASGTPKRLQEVALEDDELVEDRHAAARAGPLVTVPDDPMNANSSSYHQSVVRELHQQIEELTTNHKAASLALEQKDALISNLECLLAERVRQVESLEAVQTSFLESDDTVTRQIETLQRELQSQGRRADELARETERLREQLQTAAGLEGQQRDAKERLAAECVELQQRLGESQERLQVATAEKAAMERRVAEWRGESAQQERDWAERLRLKSDEAAVLGEQLLEVTSRLEAVTVEAGEVRRQLDRQRAERTELEEQVAALTTEALAATEQAREKAVEAAQLRESLQSAKELSTTRQKQLETMEDRLREVTEALTGRELELQEVNEQLALGEERLREAADGISLLETELVATKEELSIQMMSAEHGQLKSHQLQCRLSDYITANDGLQHQLADAQSSLKQRQQAVDELRANNAELSRSVEQLCETVERLKGEADLLRESVPNDLYQQAEAKCSRLSEELSNLQAAHQELAESFSQVFAKLTTTEELLATAKDALSDTVPRAEYDNIELQCGELEQRIRGMMGERDQLKTELDSGLVELQQRDMDLVNMVNRLQRTEEEREALKLRTNQLELEVDALKETEQKLQHVEEELLATKGLVESRVSCEQFRESEDRCNYLTERLLANTQTLADTEDELRTVKLTLRDSEARLADTEKLLLEKIAELIPAEKLVEELSGLLKVTQSQVEVLLCHKIQLQDQLGMTTNDLEIVDISHLDLRRNYNLTQKKLLTTEEELKETQLTLSQRTHQLLQVTIANTNLTDEFLSVREAGREERERLHLRLSELETVMYGRCTQLERALEMTKGRLEATANALHEVSNEKVETDLELSELQRRMIEELDHIAATAQEQVQAAEDRATSLASQLAETRQSLGTATEGLLQARSLGESLQEELRETRKRLADVTEELMSSSVLPLQQAEAHCEDLLRQLGELRGVREENVKLQAMLQDKEAEVMVAHKRLEESSARCWDLEQRVEGSVDKAEMDLAVSQCVQLERELEERVAELTTLRAEAATRKNDFDKLHAELAQVRRGLVSVTEELEMSPEAREILLRKRVAELNGQLHILANEHESRLSELRRQLDEANQRIRSADISSQKINTQTRARIASQSQLLDCQMRLAEAEEELEQCRQRLTQTVPREQLEEAERRCAVLQEQLLALSLVEEEARMTISQIMTVNSFLEGELEEARTKLGDKKKRFRKKCEELAAAEAEILTMRRQVEQAEDLLRGLESRSSVLEESSGRTAQIELEVADLRAKAEEQLTAMSRLSQRNQQLEKMIGEARLTVSPLEGKVAELTAALSQAQHGEETLRQKLEDREGAVSVLELKNIELATHINELNGQIRHLENKLETLFSDHAADPSLQPHSNGHGRHGKMGVLSSTKTPSKSAQRSLEMRNYDLSASLEQARNEILDLQARLRQRDERAEAAERRVQELVTQLEVLRGVGPGAAYQPMFAAAGQLVQGAVAISSGAMGVGLSDLIENGADDLALALAPETLTDAKILLREQIASRKKVAASSSRSGHSVPDA